MKKYSSVLAVLLVGLLAGCSSFPGRNNSDSKLAQVSAASTATASRRQPSGFSNGFGLFDMNEDVLAKRLTQRMSIAENGASTVSDAQLMDQLIVLGHYRFTNRTQYASALNAAFTFQGKKLLFQKLAKGVLESSKYIGELKPKDYASEKKKIFNLDYAKAILESNERTAAYLGVIVAKTFDMSSPDGQNVLKVLVSGWAAARGELKLADIIKNTETMEKMGQALAQRKAQTSEEAFKMSTTDDFYDIDGKYQEAFSKFSAVKEKALKLFAPEQYLSISQNLGKLLVRDQMVAEAMGRLENLIAIKNRAGPGKTVIKVLGNSYGTVDVISPATNEMPAVDLDALADQSLQVVLTILSDCSPGTVNRKNILDYFDDDYMSNASTLIAITEFGNKVLSIWRSHPDEDIMKVFEQTPATP